MKEYKFTGEIKASHIGKGGTYVEFPYDVEKEFGTKGQVKVVVFFDGIEYRGSLAKMGLPCHFIGIKKNIREKLGLGIGDMVNVSLFKDESIRTVETHPLLIAELEKNPELKARYEKLSYSKKKEIYEQLTSAKKEETRIRRLQKIVKSL